MNVRCSDNRVVKRQTLFTLLKRANQEEKQRAV